METEARGQEPPGVDTSHSDTECRATGEEGAGCGREAADWALGTATDLRLYSSAVLRLEGGQERQMSDSDMVPLQQPEQPGMASHFLNA